MKKIFNKDFKIKTFGIGWWFYILLTILALFIVTKVGNKYDLDTRRNIVMYLSIIELIVLRLYKFSLRYARYEYNFFNELPCYLCNQSTILCIVAAYLNNQVLMSYCLTAGTVGAFLALFMPDKMYIDLPFYSGQAIGFYGYHSLLVVTCLSFYTLGLYEVRLKDSLWVTFIVFILACFAHVLNYVLRKTNLCPNANYIFTYYPDNFILEKFYEWFPCKLFYMLPAIPIIGVISFIILFVLKK